MSEKKLKKKRVTKKELAILKELSKELREIHLAVCKTLGNARPKPPADSPSRP
jgi:hypothetical protein